MKANTIKLKDTLDVLSKYSANDLIRDERNRQRTEEGWRADHDDTHTAEELSKAAYCYVHALDGRRKKWPWEPESFKPKGILRNLIKAGALYLAENDRCLRAGLRDLAAKAQKNHQNVLKQIDYLLNSSTP
jgi:hypothetical protein